MYTRSIFNLDTLTENSEIGERSSLYQITSWWGPHHTKSTVSRSCNSAGLNWNQLTIICTCPHGSYCKQQQKKQFQICKFSGCVNL